MTDRGKSRQGTRWIAWSGLVALGLAAGPSARGQSTGDEVRREARRPDRGPISTRGDERRDTVYLPPGRLERLGVRSEPARPSTHPGALVLRGALTIDPERLVRVRARFGGEVVEVGTTRGAEGKERHLRPGDRVARDQTLAVIWSSELSHLKNELLNILSRLHLERETLGRIENLHKQGVVSARVYQEDKRELEEYEIEAARAERSLQARGVTPAEIEAVSAEADTVRTQGKRTPFNREKSWARFPIHSPIDGRILDAKAADGDTVESNEVIFRIADLSQLLAQVTISEADLPAVEAQPRPVRWTLRIEGRPNAAPLRDVIELFGAEIDPRDHTTTLTGIIENPEERLRPGQAITAEIDLPLDPDVVEVAASSQLASDGQGQSLIFVQPDPNEPVFVLRPVRAVRVAPGFLIVRNDPKGGLRAGEQVVTAGAEKLKAMLDGAAPIDVAR
jgi:cobalt-zinc-cadmium efflux system membrane fusion protein